MKAIFSRLFRDDLVREETRYREISEQLAGGFRERIAAKLAKLSAGAAATMLGRMAFLAAG